MRTSLIWETVFLTAAEELATKIEVLKEGEEKSTDSTTTITGEF